MKVKYVRCKMFRTKINAPKRSCSSAMFIASFKKASDFHLKSIFTYLLKRKSLSCNNDY